MCLMLYLGSNKKRPTSVWDEANPSFYVQEGNTQYSVENYQSEEIEQVKTHFSKQFVYYVGSHEDCGCGFRREGFLFQDDTEEIKKTAENHTHLFEYVAECLKDENSIEIYACWAGSENEPTKSKKEIIVSEIITDDFIFNEDELIVVEK